MKSLSKTSIYLVGLLCLLFLFFLSYFKFKIKEEAQFSNEKVNVLIIKKVCGNVGNAKDYFVFRYLNSNHIVNVDNSTCNQYDVGDTLNLYFNKENNYFFTQKVDNTNEVWGMILSGVFFLVVLLNFIFPNILKSISV